MSATERLDAIEGEAKVNTALGRTATQSNAADTLALVAALRAVLDLAAVHTEADWGDREWGDVPGWRLRQAIESALGGA